MKNKNYSLTFEENPIEYCKMRQELFEIKFKNCPGDNEILKDRIKFKISSKEIENFTDWILKNFADLTSLFRYSAYDKYCSVLFYEAVRIMKGKRNKNFNLNFEVLFDSSFDETGVSGINKIYYSFFNSWNKKNVKNETINSLVPLIEIEKLEEKLYKKYNKNWGRTYKKWKKELKENDQN
jgi:hypothetical protein